VSATSSLAATGAPAGVQTERAARSTTSQQWARQQWPRQQWVVAPAADWLLIIAAPALVLALAHHLPTFIRVYGDVELFRRFRWRFLLAPVIPLGFAVGVLVYLARQGYPLEYFLYLYILLALWDPWHFLRQHFGFMRIYDRGNAAPQQLASRMDWWLCGAWFLFIMLSSGAWLARLLEDLANSAGMAVLHVLPWHWLPQLTQSLWMAAIGITAAYLAYLAWCRRKGYFISTAKLVLCAATFGAMYLAYAPNHWMQSLAPAWSFPVGFAAIGLVHMTQYLALVWRYNRRLTAQPARARTGWFSRVHARGGWWLAAAYVALCLAYGDFITTPQSNAWLMSTLLVVGFVSTFLHYYFDGFIWKVRHRQNQENLGGAPPGAAARFSCWWSTPQRDSPTQVLARQLWYFAVPLGVLTLGAVSVWHRPPDNYVAQMQRAQRASERGASAVAATQARAAFATMNARLPALTQLAALDPGAARRAELAYLIYNRSYYAHVVLPALAGQAPGAAARRAHRSNIAAAVQLLSLARYNAIARQQPLGHAGREQLSLAAVEQTLAAWQRLLVE